MNPFLDETLEERVVSSRGRRNPRGVKREMSDYPIRSQNKLTPKRIDIRNHIRIVE